MENQTAQSEAAATKKVIEDAQALSRLDFPTIQAAVAIACSMGLSHDSLSRDTRLALEARKAHRFVADNCKYLGSKLLKMAGLTEFEANLLLRQIIEQTVEFEKAQKAKAQLHAATHPGPKGTGTA